MSRKPLSDEGRAAMVVALRDVFRARGWDGASLADLSAATGLSRATLYHHFPNGKADMAAAALADVEQRLAKELLAPLRRDGAAGDRLKAMIETLDAFYRGGDLGCLLGALSYAQDEHGLGPRVSASFDAWSKALAGLAAEDGVPAQRARENAVTAIATIQGALTFSTATRSGEPFRLALARLPSILLAKDD